MGKIVRALSADGSVLCSAINSTDIVNEIFRIHNTTPVASAALGRLATAGCIMGAMLKGEDDKLTLKLNGGGPSGNIVVAADYRGNVKCYAENPQVDLPLKPTGKLDVSGAVGTNGNLFVTKDLGLKEPYIGMTPIISGEIAEDFTNYFATSEQTPTVVALGVLVDKNGVKAAGGYLITLMPDAGEEEIVKIETALKNADSISKMLDDGKELIEIAETVTGESNLMYFEYDNIPSYECNCSKEKMEKSLITIGKEEIKDIIENEQIKSALIKIKMHPDSRPDARTDTI